MKLTARFDLERETKNALRYQERPNLSEQPMIGQLYIQKSTFGDKQPPVVFITLTLEDPSEKTSG